MLSAWLRARQIHDFISDISGISLMADEVNFEGITPKGPIHHTQSVPVTGQSPPEKNTSSRTRKNRFNP